MKKILIVIAAAAFFIPAKAQSIKLAVGKKFQIQFDSKMTMSLPIGGENMETVVSGQNFSSCEVKAVTNTGFTLILTTKRVKGSTSVMGEDNAFDSDDPATTSNPLAAGAIKMIGVPQEMVIENGVTTSGGALASVVSNLGAGLDMSSYFLTLKDEKIKEGYQWTDSAGGGENMHVFNQYTITKADAEQVDVSINSDMVINGTITQNGMELKQNMKGNYIKARIFDRKTGLLMSEKTTVTMTGNMEAMGNEIPISMKGSMATAIKQTWL